MAFNQHIAAELQARLPPTVPACTLHSLGFAAVRRAFPNVVVDDAKLRKLALELAPDAYAATRMAAEHLARLVKYTLRHETSRDGLLDLIDHYGVEVDDRDTEKVLKLTVQLVVLAAQRTETIDYDDMVWFPSRHQLRPEQYDLLCVDEAQDLNRAQQALAKAAAASGRLVPIGDRWQAIYGFTGADAEGIATLTRELSAIVLPLTVTWRCPHRHVELARRIVPALEAAPGAIDGEVLTASLKEIAEQVRPGDLVICRKNAPVVSLTYRLVLAGVPALMRGREIGRGLIQFIRRLRPASVPNLIDKIEDHREKESRRLSRKKASESQYDALNDRCDCLGQLAAQVTSLDELERFITERFDDNVKPGEAVVLSSVHRAKGLEAERVFILDAANLFLVRRGDKPWVVTQSRNLVYIACTRSKKELTFEDVIPALLRKR